MGQVTGRIVRAFRGLDPGWLTSDGHATSRRRGLDTPRVLRNFLHTDDGHLWMPAALETLTTDIDGGGSILKVVQTFTPGGTLLAQKGDVLNVWDIDASSPPYGAPDETFTLDVDEKVWTLVFDGALYIGNSAQTVKLTQSGSTYTFTDLGSGVPHGYHSMMYRNRRYVVERVFGTSGGSDQRLHYSELGDAEDYAVDGFIDITGYYQGDSWDGSLGSPIAVHPFADVLALLMTQGIVRFTGTQPDNFTLRPTTSTVGAWMRDSIQRVEAGMLFFGGTPRGEFGFYLWRGNSSELVSESLSAYLRAWQEGGQFFDEDVCSSAVWRDRYVVALDMDVEGNPDIYLYDWRRGLWSTFDGFDTPVVGLGRLGGDSLVIANAETGTPSATPLLYTQAPMARASGAAGRLVVGWEDDDQPSRLVRFLRVRLTVRYRMGLLDDPITFTLGARCDHRDTSGSDDPDIEVVRTITDPSNSSTTLEFDLNLRGGAIELDLEVAAGGDSQEVLIENLELVVARKPLKVVGAGGE